MCAGRPECIGGRLRAGINGSFGVPGENEKWEKSTHTSNTRICISTQGPRGQDEVEVKSMIYLVLVRKDMLCFVQDVRTVRGLGQGISDHYVVLCKSCWGDMD